MEHIENALDGTVPWAAFTEQSQLIGNDALKHTLSRWKHTALSGQSLGDALIVAVANYYSKYRIPVEIFTGDEGLKAFEIIGPVPNRVPRRAR